MPVHALARAAALIALAACVAPPPDAADLDSDVTRGAVTARGARTLAMDLGPGPGETLDAAVARAKAAGITTTVLNYNWRDLEPTAFQYQSAKLLADNAYFSTSPHAMSVILNLRPIAGPCRVVPPDLAGLAWDDPVMITRFGYLLTWIRGHLPGVAVQVMSVGTELDSHLAAADYPAYKAFFDAARANAKRLWGTALPVGAAVTWGGLVTPGAEQAAILDLAEHADHVLTTYYGVDPSFRAKDPFAGPIADVYAALAAIDSSAKTRGRTLDLIEVGYPTSAHLGSSEAAQQRFVSTMFGVWDAYAPRIGAMTFTWEVDLSEYAAQQVAIGDWGGGCQAPAGAPPAAPAAPTIAAQGPTGDRTWQYYVVAVNGNGNSAPSAIAAVTNGATALSATQFNRISWPAVAGATRYKVMRYASGGAPADTGLIATVAAGAALSVADTGLPSSTFTFQEFLRTLGYRRSTTPVIDKLGLLQIAQESHARGW